MEYTSNGSAFSKNRLPNTAPPISITPTYVAHHRRAGPSSVLNG